MRRLAAMVLAAAQLAIIVAGVHADAPQTPAGHVQHLAAETAPGCQPYHVDVCVVCRVLSTHALAADGAAPVPASHGFGAGPDLTPAAALHSAGPFDRLQARAPPIA